MRISVTSLLLALLLFPLTGNTTIIKIPEDYPTIQEGIDHGADGDTVLVQPDTYYENVNFNGHNVVLASLFLTTGDIAYISSTIIDGSQAGSVIAFSRREDRRAQVVGFTIENGNAFEGGGIHCDYLQSPIISSNIIRGNSASFDGGGIYCWVATPIVSDNIISGNSANHWGGGIYCKNCSPTISSNYISGNSALAGGGIHCQYSASTISDNTVSGNTASTGYGGGIFCFVSSPDISSNIIIGNSASLGGGIACNDEDDKVTMGMIAQLTMPEKITADNCGNNSVGAAFCFPDSNSTPIISSNTISGNWAIDGGGGIHCYYYSNPVITNTILWENTAPDGPEILVESSSHPVVSYCDVQGGWSGQGNIDANPLFVGPEKRDFYLRWRSPCIDAGLPDSLDPDGTRSDIGALYFNQDVLGIVELYPHHTPIVIPPEGGDLIFDGWLFNFLGHPGRADVWTYTFVPEMGRYGPLDLYENVRIPADSIGMNEITQHVPGVAPQGDYVFVAYVGDYPSTIIDSSCFYFTKTGSVAAGIADWQSLKPWFDGALASTGSGLPTHYALSQNYPNPFNATTIINYQLPVDAYVKLEIFNLFGQRLATLVDCKQQGGNRSVIWDASKFSSGIYFYRLTAGDYTFTRKMVLSK